MKKGMSMRQKWVTYLICFGLSIILIGFSLTFKVSVPSKPDLDHVKIGLPIPFVVQDLSRLDPSIFPYQTAFSSPLENPTRILWWEFIANMVILFVAMIAGLMVVRRFMINKHSQLTRGKFL